MMPLLLILFVAVGAAFIGFSIPLIRRKVPPNPWYGFRVRRTLKDPEVWYPANAYAAWRLLWVGVATIFVAVAVYFVPNLNMEVYACIVGAVTLIGVVVTLVQSFVFLHKLTNQRAKLPSDTENEETKP